MNTLRLPIAGDTYEDIDHRVLNVKAVVLDDPAGRDVRGRLLYPDDYPLEDRSPVDYSCTLATWRAVWLNKDPQWEGKQ